MNQVSNSGPLGIRQVVIHYTTAAPQYNGVSIEAMFVNEDASYLLNKCNRNFKKKMLLADNSQQISSIVCLENEERLRKNLSSAINHNWCLMGQKVSEKNQEIPQSHTADQPKAL